MTIGEAVLRQVFNGLILGSFYALVALGYSMVYGIVRMINFAHGDIFMVGCFFFLGASFAGVWGGAVFAVLACGFLGIFVYQLAYRPLLQGPRMSSLITAIGVSLVLSNGVMLISHGQFLFYADQGIPTRRMQFFLLIAAAGLMLVFNWLIRHTRLGLAMRAVSMDQETASLMGISVSGVVAVTFFLGSSLAGAAAVMSCLYYGSLHYSMGYLMGIKAFTAAVIGGIGSLPGALLGGLLLGMLETLGTQFLGSSWKDAFSFLLLILVLLVRPQGLLGKGERTRM